MSKSVRVKNGKVVELNPMLVTIGALFAIVFIIIPCSICWFFSYPFHRKSYNEFMNGSTK